MTSQVEELRTENGAPRYKVTSPKTKATFFVQKSNDGYCFFEVTTTVGSVPGVLQGKFTDPKFATLQVQKYLDQKKVSPTVERDIKYAKRIVNGSESKPDSQDNLYQGPDN